jgi:hypothetical protein
MKHASINSFSINTDASSIFQVCSRPYTQIVGLVAAPEKIRSSALQEWLTHPDIINLELTPIANRHENEKIKTFLDESALAEAPDAADGETGAAPWPAPPQLPDGRRRRLRVDLGADSAAPRVRKGGPGRPRKQGPANPSEHQTPPAGAAAVAAPVLPLSAAPASAAAPPRAPSRLRVQYRACGTDPRAVGAAAARAAELLASLGPRLCLVRREEWAEGCTAVELFAALETDRTPPELDGALKAASGAGRACLVVCVVDEDPDALFQNILSLS